MTTVTIDEATRDLIVDAVRSYEAPSLEGFEQTLRCGRRSEVMVELSKVQWICGLLDELGWEDDGAWESYSVSVDERLREWAQRHLADVRDDLDSDERSLVEVLAGNEDWYIPGKTQEASADWSRQTAVNNKIKIERLERLIEQIGSEAVA